MARLWHVVTGMVKDQTAHLSVSLKREGLILQMASCSFPAGEYDLRQADCLILWQCP